MLFFLVTTVLVLILDQMTKYLILSQLTEDQSLAVVKNVFYLTLVENKGMAFGLCPVVTPVGAVPDVIRDGDNGLLVPVNDSEAIARALARLIKDRELRTRLSARARRDFEASYDIRNYRQKLDAIYLDVCEG